MPYYLSSVGNDQQANANGNPLVGGKIYTYLAGTSTPAATYTDSTSGTSQANPIILNSLGLPASPIWIPGGQSIKFVFQDSTGVLIRTVDNVTGINDATLLITSSEWVLSGSLPTYISGTSFSLVGDQTGLFQVSRRMKSTNSGGTIYSTMTASVYASNATTVTVVNDSGVLDAGLSSVFYGLLAANNPSVATAITQASGDNSTKIATTAFVKSVAVDLTSNQTVAGVKTFSSQPVLPQSAVLGTAVATTSGTAIDFTGIPSWAKRVTVMFNGVSTNGTSTAQIQIGSGSVDTTSTYSGSVGTQTTGVGTLNFTTGILLASAAATTASDLRYGSIVFSLLNAASNIWAISGIVNLGNVAQTNYVGGVKSLSGALDRIRITTVNGTDTFDAGFVNIMWE